ncbi:hypothetical protein GQX74_000981 [Glossina fuscipes]|nr:hypothetical protein GQX74_000981 [Glossina fuscipes]
MQLVWCLFKAVEAGLSVLCLVIHIQSLDQTQPMPHVIIFCGMHFAEKDYHLMYLSDFEEPLHPFFASCKKQSVCALIAGFIYMLHAFFAFDMVLVHGPEVADEDNENYEATQPLQLYFISHEVHQLLERKYSWFREFCARPSVYRDSAQLNLIQYREHDSVGDKARLKAMISRISGQRNTGSFGRRSRGTDFERRRLSTSDRNSGRLPSRFSKESSSYNT